MVASLDVSELFPCRDESKTGLIVLKQWNFQDVSARPIIPTEIDIPLDNPLIIEQAKELPEAIPNLAARIDVSQLSLVLSCRCSREAGSNVTDGLEVLEGIKNIALVVNSNNGPVSRLAREAIMILQK